LVLDNRKNQEYRVTAVEQECGVLFSIVALLLWEFLGRFLWLGRILHSGHLGIKSWINNTIPQVCGLQFLFFAVISL